MSNLSIGYQMMTYINRTIEEKLIESAQSFPAVAVTGPRQSGKTTLLKHLFQNTHQFVTFDDPLNRERALTDPRLFLDSLGPKVILDEIQYVPELLSYIKMLIDQDRHATGRFLLTGSQHFHLMRNLGDSLAGRIALLNLLPFDMQEIRMAIGSEAAEESKNDFIAACLSGSYPEIVVQPDTDFEVWYGSYLQTYLERDVRNLAQVGDLRVFQQFVRLIASRVGQILNMSVLSNELGISVTTVKRWLSILEASHIIFLLPSYYRNMGKRIVKSPKIYFLDVGLVCYLTGIKTAAHLMNGPMAGALFENYVIQEIVKYFYHHGRRPDIFYLRTHNQLEIDIIIEQNMMLYPIEIKLSKTLNVRMAKPIEQFRNLFNTLNIQPGIIISIAEDTIQISRNVTVQSVTRLHDILTKIM